MSEPPRTRTGAAKSLGVRTAIPLPVPAPRFQRVSTDGAERAWGRFLGAGARAGIESLPDRLFQAIRKLPGNRMAPYARAGAETRSRFQRHACGNSLFRNLSGGRFEDVSEAAGVVLGRRACGREREGGWAALAIASRSPFSLRSPRGRNGRNSGPESVSGRRSREDRPDLRIPRRWR
jgi:hypothetical protein